MGMYAGLYLVSDQNVRRVMADPKLCMQLIAPDEPELWQGPAAPSPTFWSKLFGSKPAPVERLTLGEHEGEFGTLDKAWHGLHFLLTGTDWSGQPPLDLVASGGTQLVDEYADYGPPRLFESQQARAAHEALAKLSTEELRARFDPARMMAQEIYPTIWDRDPADDDTLGYLVEYLEVLRACLERAASQGLGLMVTIG